MTGPVGDRAGLRSWTTLAVGVVAQASQATLCNGIPFLIPTLHERYGMSLAAAGAYTSAPTLGVVALLVAWGALADRVGERIVLVAGPTLAALAASGAAIAFGSAPLGSPGLGTALSALFLVVAGAGIGAVNAASGRVVVGWFPAHRRGLAMGIRQMAVPLGVALGALAVPPIARDHTVAWAIGFTALVAAVAAVACAVGIVDPPRPDRATAGRHGLLENPYRRDRTLLRIHLASVILTVPQFVVWTYTLVWLTVDRDWSATSAAALITATQFLGAFGRVVVGWWSDRAGSRLRPMRIVSVTIAVAVGALAALSTTHGPIAIVVLVLASIATVAPNGLAFTAVAEVAGPYWGGRALGLHNTGQFVVGAAVGPVFGAIIGAVGFPIAFAIAAALPALAAPVVPAPPRTPRA